MIQDNHSLTESQIQHFETFGFIVRRQVFSPKEIDLINEEFEQYLTTTKGEFEKKVRDEDRRWPNWSNLNPDTPLMASLLEDPRICVPSEQLQGEDTFPVYSNCNSFRYNTRWHPDTRLQNLRMLKNLFYLQPTTGDNGSLRVIPGSHKGPLFDELIRIGLNNIYDNDPDFLKESGMSGEDIPSYIFSSQPGDVITFNMRLWHAAFNTYEDRRNCSYAFLSNPKTTDEEEDLRVMAESAKTTTTDLKMVLKDSQYYHSWWLENAEDSPKRARWIKRLDDWGFIDNVNNSTKN